MTPTLIEMDRHPAQIMNQGMFDFFHAWDMGDGVTVEYWRGQSRNGAAIRNLFEGRMVSIMHFPEPGHALQMLMTQGCKVPGVPA